MKTLFLILVALLFTNAGSVRAAQAGEVVLLGGGHTTNTPAPARSRVVAVAAGWLHVAALEADGSLVLWGNNTNGQAQPIPAADTGLKAIAAGVYHTMVLRHDGSVHVRGNDTGVRRGQTNVPAELLHSDVIALAAGYVFSPALTATSRRW